MPYLMGRASMEDYAAFRKGFDGAEEERKAAGALGSSVFQSVDDPNEVIVEIEFSTADAAKRRCHELSQQIELRSIAAPKRTRIFVLREI